MSDKPSSLESNTAIEANALCQKCGICCDGTLFSHVSINIDEYEALKKSPLDIYEKSKGKYAFKQKCACLIKNVCTAYASRPSTCQNFNCDIQRKVMNGRETLDEGQRIVVMIKQHVSWIKGNSEAKTIPEISNSSFREFLIAYLKHANANLVGKDITPNQKAFIHKIFEYTKIADRYFHVTSLLTRSAALVQKLNADKRPE